MRCLLMAQRKRADFCYRKRIVRAHIELKREIERKWQLFACIHMYTTYIHPENEFQTR